MDRFERLTGLKPVGPHRAYAEYLLARRPTCRRCNGGGVIGRMPGGCFRCPHCLGVGGPGLPNSEEMIRLRNSVLEFYPEAIETTVSTGETGGSPAPGRAAADTMSHTTA